MRRDKRDLISARYVYWWVDGIHTGLRAEESADGQCLLVILGVTPDRRNEHVAISDGCANPRNRGRSCSWPW